MSDYTKEFVPVELFGKDHWSTFAYVETVIVDRGSYKVKPDPRMRTCRTNWRLGYIHPISGVMISENDEYPTRLNNGEKVNSHDDWSCVQDLHHAKLLYVEGGELDLGSEIKLTRKGFKAIAKLREHKAKGGKFATFKLSNK